MISSVDIFSEVMVNVTTTLVIKVGTLVLLSSAIGLARPQVRLWQGGHLSVNGPRSKVLLSSAISCGRGCVVLHSLSTDHLRFRGLGSCWCVEVGM
ncbi:hypothetical protein BJX63DRAFT_334623 [Aspergillus granulosus]|uniref:Uncharacterized protein n=1 Tax=Aspergillus granulosus TaxID=176169 RepID=A0ABR4HWW6_9EURO